MHVQTHLLSGWCLGNVLRLGQRGRTLAIAAAGLADLDGLGILLGPVAYWKYHHLISHNLLFGVLLSAVLARLCEKRGRAFGVFLLLFHLHLVMDSFGSGEEWVIRYFWPFWDWEFANPYGWEFYSWQNLSAGGLFVLWTVVLIYTRRRTFFEWMMPNLDRQIVQTADKARQGISRIFKKESAKVTEDS
jgi:hypothetical protein